MSINNEARTQIRELAVILAIADAGSGNGCYDLETLEEYDNIEYGFEVPTKTGVFTSSDGTEYISNNIVNHLV